MHRFNAGFGFAQPARLRSASAASLSQRSKLGPLFKRLNVITTLALHSHPRWLSLAERSRRQKTRQHYNKLKKQKQ